MTLLRIVGAGLLAAACWAQDAPNVKEAKVEELFRLAKLDALLTQTLQMAANQVRSGAVQQMMGVKLDQSQQAQLNEFQDKVNKLVADTFSWNNVKAIYTKAYAQQFTDAELDGIIAFYKTPAGQAMVDKTPSLMAQASTAMQDRMKTMQPQMQQLMAEFQAKVKSQNQRAKPN